MTPENMLDIISDQVAFLKDSKYGDDVMAVLVDCYEKLVDIEMELDDQKEQA